MAGTDEPVAGWLARIVRLHDDIIERYGGAKGLLDVRLLEAALQRPFIGLADGTEFFPTDIEKAAALLDGLIAFHAFIDGNNEPRPSSPLSSSESRVMYCTLTRPRLPTWRSG